MFAMQSGRGRCPAPTTLTVLLALTACGPGSVAPDDDAQGDDDAAIVDDDLAGDDDAATGGTGTISVTVEVLAVLPDGQSVEAEIVVDGTPTGVFAPSEIEANAGLHTVTLQTNEPGAPVAQRFVAAPHEVSVTRDNTVACPMFVGRDLGGMWRLVEENGSPASNANDDPFEVRMEFVGPSAAEPCATSLWSRGWGGRITALCLLPRDDVWYELPDPEYPILVEGNAVDSGLRMMYTITAEEREWPSGPYIFERQE